MLIIGAKGHAKEILQVYKDKNLQDNLYFYDDITIEIDDALFGIFEILGSTSDIKKIFEKDNRFVLGMGGTIIRKQMAEKFIELNGILTSCISENCHIGSYDVELDTGLNIMDNVHISNSTKIGKGCLINYGVNIHHDCSIGLFCELSPKSQMLGRSKLGDYCSVGAGAIILPGIEVGNNVTIGAGAIVTQDIPDNWVVVGSPARKIKDLGEF